MTKKIGRPQTTVNTGETYQLAEWLNANLNDRSGLNNNEITEKLGLTRASIIPMWKTGKTRIALKHLLGIAEMTKEPLDRLFVMWVEQYVGEKGIKAKPLFDVLNRIVSEGEYELIEHLRRSGYQVDDMTREQGVILAYMLLPHEDREEMWDRPAV